MSLSRFKAVLLPHEARVADGREAGTRPGRLFLGQCFRRALDYALDHADNPNAPRLVHGRAGGVTHAWVEFADWLVFDGVAQRFYHRDGYYAVLRAKAREVYDPKSAARLSVLTGNYGPWTDGERALARAVVKAESDGPPTKPGRRRKGP
jgi:hypothetical protein